MFSASYLFRIPQIDRAQMLRQVLGGILSTYRNVAAMTATDLTDATSTRSCLVVAPHPDDETFGCGATILRKRAHGTPVRVVIVTDGRHSTKSAVISPEALAALRRREALDACSRLGLDSTDVIFLDYEDGKLETQLPDLTSRIAEL